MSKVKATFAGFVSHEGVPVLLAEGEERDEGDALVKARPELFTAPPKRPVLRGRGKAAKEPGDAKEPEPEPAPVARSKGEAAGG